MQKFRLEQIQKQGLTSQQIEMINMLQKSDKQLDDKINQELIDNPALEVLKDEQEEANQVVSQIYHKERSSFYKHKKDTMANMFLHRYTRQPLTPQEDVLQQFYFLQLGDVKNVIAEHLVGSLTEYGYLAYPLVELVEELAILYGIEVSLDELREIIHHLRNVSPLGAFARNLQECLLWQLEAKQTHRVYRLAKQIVQKYFEYFSNKNYNKIAEGLQISLEELRGVVDEISKLNPAPMARASSQETILEPDFEIHVEKERITVVMLEKKVRRLSVNKSYQEMLDLYKKDNTSNSRDAVAFIQEKINRAKWFMQAIESRKATLLKIMEGMVSLQKTFFETGDEILLRPMFLRDVAEVIGMDMSTVSRAISKKSVQVHGRVYLLKYFFSEAIATTDGKEVSSRVVKKALQQIVDGEPKGKPYCDADLVLMLKEKGYVLARRTVAKYREQMNIPIARLRKEIVV